jgi:hypothetical protein
MQCESAWGPSDGFRVAAIWSLLGDEFNRSVQHQSQSIGWGFEAQGLSRALVEAQGDRVEVGLGEADIHAGGQNDADDPKRASPP